MNEARVTIFAGHYGSGKTNLAVNYALFLKRKYADVVVADLDIVNPYFRSKDSLDVLQKAGVNMISSVFANSNLDVPAMPPDAIRIFDDKACRAVVDVGGDDRGALALGRYADRMAEEADISMLLVVNCYRPLTTTGKDVISVMHEMEKAAGFKFNGIVNNSNLGPETSAIDILESCSYVDEIAKKTGLPVCFTSVKEDIYSELNNKIPNLFPIKIMTKNIWRV